MMLCLAPPAHAVPQRPCDPHLQDLGEARIENYEALSGASYTVQLKLRLDNHGDTACVGFIRFAADHSEKRLSGPNAASLSYYIVDEADIGRLLFDPSNHSGRDIPVTVPAHSSIDINPHALVPASQPGRSGQYSASLHVSYFPAQAGDASDGTTAKIAASVKPGVQANFVGLSSGQRAELDMGELTPGLSRSIWLQVRASADVDIHISSDHHGQLRHERSDARIPYRMMLDDQSVDLSRGSRVAVGLADSIRGQNLPLAITIDDYDRAPVGNYDDVVTFTISAR
ncbi:MAG: hypothetical protein LKM31_07390 [Sphingobium sp.]|jgi:hypothetical protein|nr:hypothetical protein [Sphingobium sp.]